MRLRPINFLGLATLTAASTTAASPADFVKLPTSGPPTFMATHETTVGEFRAFVAATGHDAMGQMFTLGADDYDWLPRGHTWIEPGFAQTDFHPVVGVNLADARAYATWLTAKHHRDGSIPLTQAYRLPTDREWSLAAGLINEPHSTPEARMAFATSAYPWGDTWPPPTDFGNYAGTESAAGKPSWWGTIPGGYTDAFPRTSPVGTFAPNALGIFDLSGNVWEWVDEPYTTSALAFVSRGGCWGSDRPAYLLLAKRAPTFASTRNDELGFRIVLAPAEPPAPPPAPPPALTRVTVIFDWIANAQFAGLLIAAERGWFEEVGLDVTLQPADPASPASFEPFAATRGFAIGIADGSALLHAYAAGTPVQAFATIFQASPIGLLTLTTSGITDLAQLRGRRIGLHAYNRSQLGLMLASAGLSLDDVDPVVLTNDHHSLPAGAVDAQVAYLIDEKVAFATAGHPVDAFPGHAHGYRAYSQVYYTRATDRATHADELTRFLAATHRGWRAAQADPAAAAQLIVASHQPELDVSYQTSSLELILDLLEVESGPGSLGQMQRSTWLQTPGATPTIVDALFAPLPSP